MSDDLERPIGYIEWEMRGATPVFADDPWASDVPEMDEDALWEFVDRSDCDATEAYWRAAS